MTIPEAREKCKALVAQIPRDVLVLTTLVVTSSLSFGLGYGAGREAEQASVATALPASLVSVVPAAQAETPGDPKGVVASKNGTKYYLPSCSGADRISEANKVWFASATAAAAAGYAPAANCKGL